MAIGGPADAIFAFLDASRRQQQFDFERQQALAGLARQSQQDALIRQTRQTLAQAARGAPFGMSPWPSSIDPAAFSAGPASPSSGAQLPMMSQLPQVPSGPVSAPTMGGYGVGLPQLQQQVLSLEGNRDVVGRAGEIGPGQIMPATGAQYGYSPDQLWGDSGRQASGRIVADLYQRSRGDPAATLVGYNRGPGAMARFQAAGDNPAALQSPLAPAYAKAVAADLSPESQQQASQAAISVAGLLPPQFMGQLGPGPFAQMVHNLMGSNASDEVKGAVLEHLLPLMSQEGQRQFQQSWEMLKFYQEQGEKTREFGLRQDEIRAQHESTDAYRQATLAQQHGADWQILQTPDGQSLRVNRRTGETARVELPAGTTKLGTQPPPGVTGGADPASYAKGIAEYRLPPLSGWQLRSAWGQKVMADVLQANPEYSAPEYNARNSGTKAFATGKQGDNVRAMSVAIDHLATIEDLGAALQNGDTRRLNQLKSLLGTEFGWEGPVDFDAAKQLVGAEIAKAVIGGTNAEGDRNALRESLSKANSPEQLVGVVGTFKQLLAGQLSGLRRQYKSSTGRSDADFDALLSDRAKSELGGKGGGKGASQQQGDYTSPNDVYKAFDAGKLTKDEAKQILIDQFGFKE
jgi:hypothetical protein